LLCQSLAKPAAAYIKPRVMARQTHLRRHLDQSRHTAIAGGSESARIDASQARSQGRGAQGRVIAMADIPKRMKRMLRDYAGKAHEAELRQALAPLADAFKRWEGGALDSFDLKDLIHHFHQGPAREIYLRNATNYLDPPVAYAIATGLVDRATVPPELLAHLARDIEFYQDQETES
jgi:hypothetical protein